MLYNQDQNLILDAAKGMLDSIAPVAAFRELRDNNPDANSDAVWNAIAEMGWSAILVPEEYDGLELTAVEAGIVALQLGKHLTTSPFLSSAILATTALSLCDNQPLKTALLPTMASGETRIAFCCDQTARHNGQSEGIPCTIAGIESENGKQEKNISTQIANIADFRGSGFVILYLSIADEPVLACVSTTAEGLASEPLSMIDGSSASKVTLNSVSISNSQILARGTQATAIVEKTLAYGRALLAAELIGAAEEAMHRTVEYLKERKQFGVAIGSFQALQHRAAILYSEIELARSITLKALFALAAGEDNATALAAAAKSKANDTAILAGQEGVQLHGGIGMTDEHDIGLFLKRIRTSSVKLGDSHHLKSLYAALSGY